MKHRAVLIQDIRDYVLILRPYLESTAAQMRLSVNNIELMIILEWIIREEIFEIYLTPVRHHHPVEKHRVFRDILRNHLPYNLNILTAQCIKVPKLYDDQDIVVNLRYEYELRIHFHTTTRVAFT